MKKWLLGIGLLALVLAFGCTQWGTAPAPGNGAGDGTTPGDGTGSGTPPSNGDQPPTTSPPDETVVPEVRAGAQTLGDQSVRVSFVSAPQPAWVVIHADDGGAPGAIIGQRPVNAGTVEDLEVSVDEQAVTPFLHVMLHADNGTRGVFEPGTVDTPMATGDAIAVSRFRVTVAEEPLAQADVRIDTGAFDPAEITVGVGETVTWVNTTDLPHTVRSVFQRVVGEDQGFRSEPLARGETFSYAFTEPGEFEYYSDVDAEHIRGTVRVE